MQRDKHWCTVLAAAITSLSTVRTGKRAECSKEDTESDRATDKRRTRLIDWKKQNWRQSVKQQEREVNRDRRGKQRSRVTKEPLANVRFSPLLRSVKDSISLCVCVCGSDPSGVSVPHWRWGFVWATVCISTCVPMRVCVFVCDTVYLQGSQRLSPSWREILMTGGCSEMDSNCDLLINNRITLTLIGLCTTMNNWKLPSIKHCQVQ